MTSPTAPKGSIHPLPTIGELPPDSPHPETPPPTSEQPLNRWKQLPEGSIILPWAIEAIKAACGGDLFPDTALVGSPTLPVSLSPSPLPLRDVVILDEAALRQEKIFSLQLLFQTLLVQLTVLEGSLISGPDNATWWDALACRDRLLFIERILREKARGLPNEDPVRCDYEQSADQALVFANSLIEEAAMKG